MKFIPIISNMVMTLTLLNMTTSSINLLSDANENVNKIRVLNKTGDFKVKISDIDISKISTNHNDFESKLFSKSSTLEFNNSTEMEDNEMDNIHSNFNLAIIPAAAVFVFIVVICFKCCKWFRQYTRGDDKENNNFYAVIVTDNDNEHVDITSDTTSTVCYDTVSSNGSFLKRSGNESTFNSIRYWRQGSFKGEKGLSSTLGHANKNSIGEHELIPASFVERKINEHMAEDDFRISTSSTDTVSERICDSIAIKRNDRFRVSFVTETNQSKAEKLSTDIRQTCNDKIKPDNPMRSSLKKASPKAISNEPVFTFTKGIPQRNSFKAKMVNVGTQTNKSFRYSLRKSKSHVSDTDLDGRFVSALVTTERIRFNSREKQHKVTICNSNHTLSKPIKHSSFPTTEERNSSLSTIIPEILNYPSDTNGKVIQNSKQAGSSIADLELDDDVFEDESCNDSINSKLCNCESDPVIRHENMFKTSLNPENALCEECKKVENGNVFGLNYNTDSSLHATYLENINTGILCYKCMANFEDIKSSCGGKRKGVYVVNSYTSPDGQSSRHSSNLSFESSGYAELSSNESFSTSPILTQ